MPSHQKQLDALARTLAKSKPEKAHPLVYRAFTLAVLAGDTAAAQKLLDGLAAEGYSVVRERLTANCFQGGYPKDDAWQKKKRDDPWYAIDRWRRAQSMALTNERDALERLRAIMADWPEQERGPGYGSELALALDLAFRHGEDATPWLRSQGHRIDDDLAETMMCVPSILEKMRAKFFRPVMDASFDGVIDALKKLPASTPPTTKVPKVQKRTVTCEYSQVHLEPQARDKVEFEQVFFQDDRESAQGMSVFPTIVGIATPSETESVRASITIEAAKKSVPKEAVQAVAFPLKVRSPLVLRSVSDDDDNEPIFVPNGDYDVLAVFTNEKKAAAGMRKYDLAISFHPRGSLKAPQCYVLEDGTKPPRAIFMHGL